MVFVSLWHQAPVVVCISIKCLCRCTDFSKRTAKCQILLEHGDAIWELNINYYVIAEPVFEKMHPAPARQGIHKSSSSTQTSTSISYESLRTLNDIRSFSDITGEWLTMEAIMPPCKANDCQGHFQNNPALPHSFMIIPNMGRFLLNCLPPSHGFLFLTIYLPYLCLCRPCRKSNLAVHWCEPQ
jgi:hypothetical protein